MKENFYKVPNIIVWDYRKDSSMIADSKVNIIIPIHCALLFNRNVFNIVSFNISQICEFIKLPKRTESYNRIKQGLSVLYDNNYFCGEIIDIKNLKTNDNIASLYLPFDMDSNGTDGEYFTLTETELYSLMKDNYNELNFYSYISARIYKNKDNKSYAMTGKYEVCFPSYQEIIKHLNTSSATIRKTMLSLEEDNLIYWKNAGQYTFTNESGVDEIKQGRNIITLTKQHEYKSQVAQSKKYFRENSGYNFLPDKRRSKK